MGTAKCTLDSTRTKKRSTITKKPRVLVRSLNKAFLQLQMGMLTVDDLANALFLLEEAEDVGFFAEYHNTERPWPSAKHRRNAVALRRSLQKANAEKRVVWMKLGETVITKLRELLVQVDHPVPDVSTPLPFRGATLRRSLEMYGCQFRLVI